MYTDIAAITKHHLVGLLGVWRSTHVTYNVLVILDAQTLLALEDRFYLAPATQLKVTWTEC